MTDPVEDTPRGSTADAVVLTILGLVGFALLFLFVVPFLTLMLAGSDW